MAKMTNTKICNTTDTAYETILNIFHKHFS